MMKNEDFKKVRFKLVSYNNMDAFRENVRKYLETISLRELADRSGINYETLKSFVYGKSKDCNLSLAVKLAHVFGCSVDELIGSTTICKETKESMCMLNVMPPQFTKYVRWAIRNNYANIQKCKTDSCMNVMIPKWDDNMVATHIIEPRRFDCKEDIIAKSFLGIEIPCDEFIPHFYKGDTILIANDRKPRNREYVVVRTGTSFWLVQKEGDNHITLTDRRINNNGEYLGYVCHIEKCEE